MRSGPHCSIMSIFFVLSLFLLLDVPKWCIATKEYDYLLLVQQWPKGFCDYQKIVSGNRQCKEHPIPNRFTIHGLWPQKTIDPQPETCNATNPLNETDIKPLEKLLASNWPNLIGVDFKFWAVEWLKHGTCAEKQFSKIEYFQLALHTHYQNNLLNMLAKEKIVPDEKKLYNVTSVVAAIREHTKHDPRLGCYLDTGRNATALYQITVCLSFDGTSYINCTNPHGSCPRPQLLYPKE